MSLSSQIARDLREQYTLGFTPDQTDKTRSFRKIEVKVTAPSRGKILVRTRSGYSAAGENSSPAAPAPKGAK